jgi:hypothetical protein
LSRLKKISFLVSLLYCAYLAKSALGINLSHNFAAPKVLKIPLKALTHPVNAKKHHRHDRARRISLDFSTKRVVQNV